MTESPPPLTQAELLALLARLGIPAATYAHRPVFTVEEGLDLKAAMPGGHTKNLFLKDKKGALTLVSARAETRIDLHALAKAAGAAGRYSFANADLLAAHLGVTPGSVTLFAIANDRSGVVRLLLDAALWQAAPVHFHPLVNTATTAIDPADIAVFLAGIGRRAEVATFSEGAIGLSPL